MVERLLDDNITSEVKNLFTKLDKPVQLLFWGKKDDCMTCDDTLRLVKEVAELSDKINLKLYDIDTDAAVAKQYNVHKVPGLVIAGKDGDRIIDYGIRYHGLPAGHEFGAFINDFVLVSSQDSGLSDATKKYLHSLTDPLLFMVFTTPTCPYCPRAVLLAHQFALESPLIQAEVINAQEFPELSEEHGVSGMPHTAIIRKDGEVLEPIVNAYSESQLVADLQHQL